MDPDSIGKLCAKYQLCAIHTADNTDGKVTMGEYKPWTNHGRNMDDPWTTGFYSSGAALASRFIAQALRR